LTGHRTQDINSGSNYKHRHVKYVKFDQVEAENMTIFEKYFVFDFIPRNMQGNTPSFLGLWEDLIGA
jgi:hypothetical protein